MTDIWGTPRGYVDVRPNEPTAGNSMQSAFKVLYDAFEHWQSLGYVERVALNYGLAGTGTDFYDGGAPFTSNAWFTYKFPKTARRPWTYYAHVQYSEGAGNFGQAPGDPGLLRGNTGTSTAGLGIQFALGLNSNYQSVDAWAGTTNFDGADTKGAPLWTCPSDGSVHVFPRSNNNTGPHATLKENFIVILDTSTRDHRLDYLCDGDHFQLWLDFSDDQVSHDYVYFGPYKPRTDSRGIVPFVCAHVNENLPNDSGPIIGTITGTAYRNGGILHKVANGVGGFAVYSYGNPSNWAARTTPVHDISTELGLPVLPMQLVYDDAENNIRGLVGETYARKWGYVSPAVAVLDDVAPAAPPYKVRIFDFTSSAAAWHQCLMWGGTSLPRATTTRQGVLI